MLKKVFIGFYFKIQSLNNLKLNSNYITGEYIYFLDAFGPTHKFFGPILAFIFAWVTVFLINPSSVAILSLSFAKYLSSPILTAVNFCPDEYLTYVLDRLLATICIGTRISYY
jgi:L-type amino acid transporter 9